ncbi:fructosamine kinase family protein [Rhodobacteraceae bacterium]|nr:fructosamine kinase family protein [Paracoccaceae bacterium]
MEHLAQAGAALLGETLRDWQALSGGDISSVLRITTGSGRRSVVKNGPAPRTEAAMLQCLAQAGAPTPQVRAASAETLVLNELRHDGGLDQRGWAELGQVLRTMHAHHGTRYGWHEDYAFGPVPVHNAEMRNWPDFWAECRLLPELDRISAGLSRRIEALAKDLPNRLPAAPPAALLHGDLWTGNVMAYRGGLCALIDPACYYGDGEVDLAMLQLFGRIGESFHESYGTLAPHADERRAIYQLWPAIVHLRLFGAGYRNMVDGLLTQARA